MGGLLQQLWMTLAILVSCGLAMPGQWFSHGYLNGSGCGLEQALIAVPATFTPNAGAGSLRCMVKRQASGAEAKPGLRLPRHDGDGSSPDPVVWAGAPIEWLFASLVVSGSRFEDRWPVLQGMDPKEGGKRAPPVFCA